MGRGNRPPRRVDVFVENRLVDFFDIEADQIEDVRSTAPSRNFGHRFLIHARSRSDQRSERDFHRHSYRVDREDTGLGHPPGLHCPNSAYGNSSCLCQLLLTQPKSRSTSSHCRR
jgi:hypothetical protein